MAGVRVTELQSRPMAFLDVTSVTLDEFQPLVPPFETACQCHMAAWRMDGKPRTARRFPVYQNCPLPPPEDRLLFMLTYSKAYALHVLQGRLGGLGQRTATRWMHGLWPALRAALRALGEAPARALTALAQRLGISEADVATVVTPLEEALAPVVGAPAAPLVPMTGRNGASSAPTTLWHRPTVRAARTRPTPATMSCACMPCSSSASSATPMAVASMTSPLPTPPRTPGLLGAGGCRSWAFWRSHSLRW